MNGDSIACQNLSLEYKALASRALSSKDPTINERQYRIAKEKNGYCELFIEERIFN